MNTLTDFINELSSTSRKVSNADILQFIHILKECESNGYASTDILGQLKVLLIDTDNTNITLGLIDGVVSIQPAHTSRYTDFVVTSLYACHFENLKSLESAKSIEQIAELVSSAVDTTKNVREHYKGSMLISQDLHATIASIKNSMDRSEKNFKDTESKISDLIPQELAIIGIFSALLLVFFGGINILDSIRFLKNEEPYIFVFILLITGQIMISFLILMMYFVSRMSNRTINVRCAKFKDIYASKPLMSKDFYENPRLLDTMDRRRLCAFCYYSTAENNDKCGYIDKIINRYPYIFFITIILFVLETLVGIWWIMAEVRLLSYVQLDHPFGFMVSVTLIAFILFLCLVIILLSLGKYNKKEIQKTTCFVGAIALTLSIMWLLWCFTPI